MSFSRLFIGLGANITPAGFANQIEGCAASLTALEKLGVIVEKVSNWYESAPVPLSGQPWYLNAVASASTQLTASQTLMALHEIEHLFGRVRNVRNEARVLDLDLLDFHGLVSDEPRLMLPHPRLQERAFVLLPLRELCADWRHPISGKIIDEIIDELPTDQEIRLFTQEP